MEKQNKTRGMIPLNIQLFAEPSSNDGGGNPDNGKGNEPQTKTYTEEEYNKLKSSFDKTASEIAELKKQLKAKQTDDEKKAEEEAEKEKQYNELVKQNKEMKIANKLATAGYSEKDIQTLSKPILEGDVDALCTVLSDLRKTMTEEITKAAQDQFNKSSKIPGGKGNTSDNDTPEEVQAYIDAKKNSVKNNARSHYFGINK